MKQKVALVGLLSLCLLPLSGVAADEKAQSNSLTTQEKISQEAAQEHILAAEELEEAAGHHRRVAQYYKAGKLEDAGWNAYMAYAHSVRAQDHINAAARLHLSEKRNLTDKTNPPEPKP